MEKRNEIFDADDYYTTGTLNRNLLGGTAISRKYFYVGLAFGKLAVDAITMRDYPVIQAYVVWMAIIYVLVNLITDLLYHRLDPRIRLGVTKG